MIARAGDAPITVSAPDAGLVARPATAADRDAIARLFVGAFPAEFGLLFGARTAVAEAVVAHVLDCDYPSGVGAWVATLGDGAVVGFLLLDSPPQFRARHTLRLGWHVLWRHVRLFGLPRLALGLLMPSYGTRAGEVYVRAIGVDARYRRRGAARLLLRCADAWGRRERKAWLGLHVHSENEGAHALYREAGFVDRGYRPSLVTRLALGQRGHYYMARPLRENGDRVARG